MYHWSFQSTKAMTGSRQTLIIKRKQEIIAENKRRLSSGRGTSQTALAQWEKEKLKPNAIPNQATIFRLLKTADSFINLLLYRSVFLEKQPPADAPDLESALYKWICHHTNCGRQIDGPLTVHYAKKLKIEANKSRTEGSKLHLKFPDGWQSRFKSRYGLSYCKGHGEAISADDAAIEKLMLISLSLITIYNESDVWNSD